MDKRRALPDHFSHIYNEKELLTGFTNREVPAFTAIYNRYYTGILFFAQRFVDQGTAEDIIAESFIKLWQSANVFGSLAQVHQWLRVSVRNACLNQLRQQKHISRKQAEMLYLSDQEYEYQYSQAQLYADLHTRIVAEIEKMPAQQQRILKMAFLEGMSNTDIAAQLKISVQAVKNQKVTALKALRNIFGYETLVLYTGFISMCLSQVSK